MVTKGELIAFLDQYDVGDYDDSVEVRFVWEHSTEDADFIYPLEVFDMKWKGGPILYLTDRANLE